jgi:hypothetical protein
LHADREIFGYEEEVRTEGDKHRPDC